MDPITLGFYATVCGALSIASPRFGTFLPRLVIGAGVGIVAAALLPVIRQGLGFY
ncbi:hypothetical protein [Alterinioella nitratireducens]|jgi:hypothetical protein|uniref:hypothetical protein n=1 Tax=Alterinioella nitratireducens TaxID=2735915 RepID=UPI00155407CC|nr:hypothetical protein [Alterinioella nitratireducens]NPD18810.1 hypothetical protein [Alterinioella nitratireducens]|tara:strand:- start:1205 stop:1369 length:165 start_codon:yes stop_codon:yes gene_type:complete